MTLPSIARCPRCGTVKTVYIRSDDGSDLVCLSNSCREGRSLQPPTEHATMSSRRAVGR